MNLSYLHTNSWWIFRVSQSLSCNCHYFAIDRRCVYHAYAILLTMPLWIWEDAPNIGSYKPHCVDRHRSPRLLCLYPWMWFSQCDPLLSRHGQKIMNVYSQSSIYCRQWEVDLHQHMRWLALPGCAPYPAKLQAKEIPNHIQPADRQMWISLKKGTAV